MKIFVLLALFFCCCGESQESDPCGKANSLVFDYIDGYCTSRDCCECECFSRRRWYYGNTYPCECGSAIISVFNCEDEHEIGWCLDNPEFCAEKYLDQVIYGGC
jgi:hypothetical protein